MPTSNADRAVMFVAGAVIGLAVGIPVGALITAEPRDTTVPAPTTADPAGFNFTLYRSMVTGLDPAEDDPAFDCRVHGNRICGPGNSQGVAPGVYRDVQPGTTLVDFMLAVTR